MLFLEEMDREGERDRERERAVYPSLFGLCTFGDA
jgi:hypothetical protein